MTEISQDQVPPEPSPSGPSQISPNITEPAGSADGVAVGDIASSLSLSRMLTYGTDPENIRGRPPTPRDSEIDREEATMDLQAVC